MNTFSQKPPRGSTPQPDHIFLSINGDAKTSMTVTWRTSLDVADGYALCREEGGAPVRFDAETDVFESDIDVSRLYWAHMTGLKPGTTYRYTVGDGTHRSEEFWFTTEPENEESFRFLCISDQQKGTPHDLPDYSGLKDLLTLALERHPDVRFILTGGDNTDCGQHEVQWNGMFSGLTGIVEHLPYMMAVGNHDTRGFADYATETGRYYSEPAEFFCRQCRGSYPDNGPEGWKTETYAFDYGNAHFSMIAVNGPEDVNRWLLRDIPASDRAWKLGAYHFPIYYSGPELSNDDAYPVMREGMEQLDVLFSGHEHNFSRSFPIRNESLFDRPSQGTVHYELGNANDNPPGTMTVKKVWHAAYYPQATHGSSYAIVEVFRDKLVLTDYLDDGRIVDQCVIDKAKDEILPHALAPVYRRPRLFYKGVDLGIGQKDCYPEQRDGVWFAPLCVMFSVICAEVVKEPGTVTLGVYGHRATFTEGSAVAVTERGEVQLPAPVYRGMRGQLYIPVEAVVSCFDMKWNYAVRNNFLSVEHATEQIPFTEQP